MGLGQSIITVSRLLPNPMVVVNYLTKHLWLNEIWQIAHPCIIISYIKLTLYKNLTLHT